MKDITQFNETAPNSLLSYTKEAEEEIKNEFGDAVAKPSIGKSFAKRLQVKLSFRSTRWPLSYES
jgi:hypothetical protein